MTDAHAALAAYYGASMDELRTDLSVVANLAAALADANARIEEVRRFLFALDKETDEPLQAFAAEQIEKILARVSSAPAADARPEPESDWTPSTAPAADLFAPEPKSDIVPADVSSTPSSGTFPEPPTEATREADGIDRRPHDKYDDEIPEG